MSCFSDARNCYKINTWLNRLKFVFNKICSKLTYIFWWEYIYLNPRHKATSMRMKFESRLPLRLKISHVYTKLFPYGLTRQQLHLCHPDNDDYHFVFFKMHIIHLYLHLLFYIKNLLLLLTKDFTLHHMLLIFCSLWFI